MGRKLSGKDGLNIWVTNFKENLVDKLVGKWVKKGSGKQNQKLMLTKE